MSDTIAEQNRSVRYGIMLLAAALVIGLVVAAAMTMNLVRPLRRLLKGAMAEQGPRGRRQDVTVERIFRYNSGGQIFTACCLNTA